MNRRRHIAIEHFAHIALVTLCTTFNALQTILHDWVLSVYSMLHSGLSALCAKTAGKHNITPYLGLTDTVRITRRVFPGVRVLDSIAWDFLCYLH